MHLASLALTASAALLTTGVVAERCTPGQRATFQPLNDAIPPRCLVMVDRFETCSDECLAPLEAAAKAAPNCSTLNTNNITELQLAAALADMCKKARASTANKYTPQESPNAPKCSYKAQSNWESTYNKASPFGQCSKVVENDKTCSDDCLKILEDDITAAPACLAPGNNYTLHEYKKYQIVHCLNARKEDLKTNKVLQSEGTASSKSSSDTKSPSASTKDRPLPQVPQPRPRLPRARRPPQASRRLRRC